MGSRVEFSGEFAVEPFPFLRLPMAQYCKVIDQDLFSHGLILPRPEHRLDVTAPDNPRAAVPVAAIGGWRGDDYRGKRKHIFEQVGVIGA